jgi:hypothetical protein
MTQSLSYLELDLPKCGLRYGQLPCTATISGLNILYFPYALREWGHANSASYIGTFAPASTVSMQDPYGGYGAYTWVRGNAVAYVGSAGGKPASAALYTASAFFKRGTHRYVAWSMQDSGSFGRVSACFDLLEGTVVAGPGVTGTFSATGLAASIRPVGNGWFKCTVSGTTNAAATVEVHLSGRDDANASVDAANANAVGTLHVYGMDLYAGAAQLPFRPTGFVPIISWDFRNGSTNGWTAGGTGGSVTGSDEGMIYAPAGIDSNITSPVFSVAGTYPVIRLEMERLTNNGGTTDSVVFYASTGGSGGAHGFSGSFYKAFNSTTGTDWGSDQSFILDLYMQALTAGTNDWFTGTISQLRIDLDGTSPGTWRIRRISIGTSTTGITPTGTAPCLNTISTCQDRANYTEIGATARFTRREVAYRPDTIDALPFLEDVSYQPGAVSLGEGIGERSGLDARLCDGIWPDTGVLGDPYLPDRGFDPKTRGTFLGRLRARHPYTQQLPVRWYIGELGQTLDQMEVHHFLTQGTSGPSPDSAKYSIKARDPFRLLDGEQAQLPRLSNGYLSADISAVATSLILSPVGIGDAEYAESGYVAIGAKEIAAFTRPYDYETVLHFDGADTSTTITDATGQHTWTAVGNAQIDTAQSVFGGASLLLDGAGDYVTGDGSSAFAGGTGDIRITCRIRLAAIGGVDKGVFDFGTGSGDAAPALRFRGASAPANCLYATFAGIVVINPVGGTALAANTWYHICLSRTSGTWRLHINGTAEASTGSNASAMIVGAARPIIGARYDALSGSSFNGHIEEFNIQMGVGQATNFTPPASATVPVRGDTLRLTRAQYSTTAQAHVAQDLVQMCKVYSAVSPADILYDMMVTEGPIPSEYVPLASWQSEVATYLPGAVYTTIIAVPTSIKKLVAEIAEHAGLAMWWNDTTNQFGMQVLRSVAATREFNETNTEAKSIRISDQPDKRRSEVWTYFAQKNPLTSLDDEANYRSVAATADLQAESDYGSPNIQKVFSRWIGVGGRAIALRLNDLILSRYRDPPRAVSFRLSRAAAPLALAGGYNLRAWSLQDALGSSVAMPFQVTRLGSSESGVLVEGQEALYNAPATDLNNRQITFDTDIKNVNLRTVHDALYGTPGSGDTFTVTATVEAGVTIGSVSTMLAALNLGELSDWPAGVTLVLNIAGRIQGKGGQGGQGGSSAPSPFPGGAGLPGGTALYTRKAVTINYIAGGGQVWSGAGGGGGGTGGPSGPGGGGGGGAGDDPGIGGYIPATDTAGGFAYGAGSAQGGNGGGPGLVGNNSLSAVGGARGHAIDGVSLVVTGTGTSDIRGTTVN